ncbi:YheC/YheD family protein [Cohnella endophytica]|uniref:YheC/YheD family protein n=1 Tax=Cohnella endophytica TaxID=2419778 RepID=A0A494Y630_9BACL|nr:YheC/YheD family protein [Cohnella endophytica]RKP58130.1 YheC/YheD family protein [Cohnella endophytica]
MTIGGDAVPQYVSSKWKKTEALLRNRSLQNIIPKTVRFNRIQLKTMLESSGMVYIKPDTGSYGNGVMRVERKKGRYSFQAGERLRTFSTFDFLFEALRKETKSRRYLIQRGIHLLKYKGRRFDLRVMVQLNPKKAWETTGIIGRVAAPRKIVTNFHNGGKPMSATRLLGQHLNKQAMENKINSLEVLGVRTAKTLRRKFPGLRVIGLDVGMDPSLTPWILEVNTNPDPYIFRKLPDPTIFRTIQRYAKAYGRK